MKFIYIEKTKLKFHLTLPLKKNVRKWTATTSKRRESKQPRKKGKRDGEKIRRKENHGYRTSLNLLTPDKPIGSIRLVVRKSLGASMRGEQR